jgi:hypothetical protein
MEGRIIVTLNGRLPLREYSKRDPYSNSPFSSAITKRSLLQKDDNKKKSKNETNKETNQTTQHTTKRSRRTDPLIAKNMITKKKEQRNKLN